MVGIPPGTRRDVLKGISAHLPIYADATYLFIFRCDGHRHGYSDQYLSSELAAGGARTDGSLSEASLAAPVRPTSAGAGGVRSAATPATSCRGLRVVRGRPLIGAAMLTGVALAQARGGAFASVLGRGIAHLTIYLPALALYFIVVPRVYGSSTLGNALDCSRWRHCFSSRELPGPGRGHLVQTTGDAEP